MTAVTVRPRIKNYLTPGVYESREGIFILKLEQNQTRITVMQLVEVRGSRATGVVAIEFERATWAIFILQPTNRMTLERAKEVTARYEQCIVCGAVTPVDICCREYYR